MRFVANLFSRLVEFLLHRVWRCVVLQHDRHECQARPRKGIDMIVPAQLLNALFERLGDEVLHLLRRRARPSGRYGKDLDSEEGIFGAAQIEEGEGAGESDRDNQEQSDRALANGQRREVEPVHCAAAWFVAMRMRSPSWRSCAPSATICSPSRSPLRRTALSSPSWRIRTGRNETEDA